MRGRAGAPFRLQRGEARQRQPVERLIPGPPGGGDDLGDQRVEVYFPGGGDASGVASLARARRPAAFATEGKA